LCLKTNSKRTLDGSSVLFEFGLSFVFSGYSVLHRDMVISLRKNEFVFQKKRGININILWDFDGTLFDTYPALVEGFIALSQKELDRSEVLEWLKIDSKTAFKHYGIDENQRADYQNLHNYHSKQHSRPFDHLEEVLASVDSNIIVTHRDKESTIFLLKKYKLSKYFKEIVSVEEQGFTRKPHSASYEYVLKNHHIDLVVGDRDLDLIPARKLNIKTVAFQNRNITADFYIDSYEEFIPMVLKPLRETKTTL
jgi:phosphoglycolate phosphatase-like HAD superfamily hydrolase